jgi:cell division protein FtsN
VLTGLLIAVLGGVIVLFSYAHRRELGESLIRWGQRLAARPEARRQVTIAGPQTAAPSPEPPSNKAVSSARSNAESPLVKPERGATPLVQRLENPAKPQQLSLNLPTAVIMPQRRSVPMLPNSLRTRAAEIAATHPPDSAAMFSRAPAVKPPPDKINSVVQLPLTNVTYAPPSVGSAPTLQMYFDLGKFRNELSAQDLREEVARLGLRTTVFHERHFWRDSYQVLVGPYSNEEEEKTTKNNLISHGYKARALERGSRSFAFSFRVTLNGSRLPAGDFTINWESYVADVRVKFMQNGQVIATAKGSWVPMSYRYIQNAFVSAVHPDGSRTLLQIWFSGFNRALVFHN